MRQRPLAERLRTTARYLRDHPWPTADHALLDEAADEIEAHGDCSRVAVTPCGDNGAAYAATVDGGR